MAKGPVRVTFTAEWRGRSNSHEEVQELDRARWDAMTPEQRKAWMDELAEEFLADVASYGWNLHDPDDEKATED